MAHPFNNLRSHKVEHARVSNIARDCGGRMAAGGAAPSSRFRAKSARVTFRADGGSVKARADRPSRAFGGKLGSAKKKGGKKKSGNNVNVIVSPPQQKPMLPPPPPPGVAAGPPPMPPKPPMAPPPGAGPMPPPGALPPPGMPPRYAGGRAYKKGGAVFSGTPNKKSHTVHTSGSNKTNADSAGVGRGRTPVQHSPNKQDGKNIGRGPVITKAYGGPISSPAKGDMGPKLPGGAGGGKGRLFLKNRAIKSGYDGATRNAQNPTRNP